MIAWLVVYLRHLVVATARCFYGTHEDYEQARLRLERHLDNGPRWLRSGRPG